MFNPSYLMLSRHGVYYFRFPIPQNRHPDGMQSHVKLSLATRSPKEALHLARGLCYGGNYLLSQMKATPLEYYQIRQFLVDFFKERIEWKRQKMRRGGQFSYLDRVALENGRDFAGQALDGEEYSLIGSDGEIDQLIADYDLDISKPSSAYEMLRVEFLKAYQSYCEKVLEENANFGKYDFDDTAKEAYAPSRTLAAAITDYVKEKQLLGEWDEKTVRAESSKFELLKRFLGEDRELAISLELAISMKALLMRLPKHINTRSEFEGKTLQELSEMEGYPKLGVVTVNKHIQVYSGFYNWLVKRKEVSENNFAGLLVRVKNVAKTRKSFAQSDIDRILAKVLPSKQDAQKWGVLLAFYTGARLNEIAQLEVADIAEVEGVWCMCVTDEGDERKSLKTVSSKCNIPLHSKLIELGFLDYVKGQRNRLFPKLTYHIKDGYGRNLGRWFNDSLLRKQLEIADKALVFHSIRHTVATRLRNAQVDDRTLKDILGHAQGDVTSRYIDGKAMALMQQAIEKLDYKLTEPQKAASAS